MNSSFRRCEPPAPRNRPKADLMAFAASGGECWGREFESESRADKAVLAYRIAHRKNKADLAGVRVVKRGLKLFLVRDGGAPCGT